MILEVYQTVLAAYGTALGVATRKGYPTWGKPEADVPCVALEYYQFKSGQNRLGQAAATGAHGYRGWVFASHEPELCALADALEGWHRTNGTFEIATRRVACELLEMKRHDSETGLQQEQHGVAFLIQALW